MLSSSIYQLSWNIWLVFKSRKGSLSKAAIEQCFSVKLKAPVLVPTAFHNKTLTATQQHRIKKCKVQTANPFCWHKNYEWKKCIHDFVHFVVGIQTASLKIWIRENPKSSPSLRQVVPPGFHLLLHVQNLIRQVVWDLEVKWAKIQRISHKQLSTCQAIKLSMAVLLSCFHLFHLLMMALLDAATQLCYWICTTHP